jgi:phage terminase large subunit GpA-like protein
VYRWDAGGRRNEALDCFVYALAALYIAIDRFGINLEVLSKAIASKDENQASTDEPPKPKKPKKSQANNWLNGGSAKSGGWL